MTAPEITPMRGPNPPPHQVQPLQERACTRIGLGGSNRGPTPVPYGLRSVFGTGDSGDAGLPSYELFLIHVATVAHSYNLNDEAFIFYCVHDAISANAHSVGHRRAGKLPASNGPWVAREGFDRRGTTLRSMRLSSLSADAFHSIR